MRAISVAVKKTTCKPQHRKTAPAVFRLCGLRLRPGNNQVAGIPESDAMFKLVFGLAWRWKRARRGMRLTLIFS